MEALLDLNPYPLWLLQFAELRSSFNTMPSSLGNFPQWLIFWVCLLAFVVPAMAAPSAPFPEPGITVAGLATFFAALQAYANMTDPPRTTRQCIAGCLNSLSVMDARIRTAWQNYSETQTAAGNDPFAITADEFRELCVRSVRRPDELQISLIEFQRLRCHYTHQIHDFTCTFRRYLDIFRALNAPIPDGLNLAHTYVSKLPTSVIPALLSRPFDSFETAAALAAAHVTAAPSPGVPASTATGSQPGPMELAHIEFAEQFGLEIPAAEHLFAIVRQQFERRMPSPAAAATPTTPARHGSATPARQRLPQEEKDRRAAAGLCNYCGLHPMGTYCAADAQKKSRRNGQNRQGNV